MTLIGLSSVEKFYGGRAVLRGLGMKVNAGARIGLVGGNGAGKSTVLRILAGTEGVDGGEVIRRRGVSVATLPQYIEGDERTPMEVVCEARSEISDLLTELETCEEQLASPGVAADLRRMQRMLERQDRLLSRFTELGGPGFEGEARGYLRSLGLFDGDIDRPMKDLSGGQRKLAVLASCLARRPDVLLLDEPESHLDAGRRERLEALIQAFDGAVVVVSHDRYLLDETVTEIAELEGGRIKTWPGNYSAYALARELALKRQQQLYVTQQKEIARLEEAIRRFQQWAHNTENERHARQARVKQRQIERMDKIDRPVLERRRIGLGFRENVRGGKKVLELREASVAFGEEPVLIGVDLTVARGERVGVIGANGAGKSVLAKLLAGIIPPTEGERWGLQLLLLMLGDPNCPILDEPTNHLDIDSLEVLERELERFPGTVVFVSHDRYFLDRISDKTVEVRDAGLYRYEGGYSAWRHSKVGQRGRISASAAG